MNTHPEVTPQGFEGKEIISSTLTAIGKKDRNGTVSVSFKDNQPAGREVYYADVQLITTFKPSTLLKEQINTPFLKINTQSYQSKVDEFYHNNQGNGESLPLGKWILTFPAKSTKLDAAWLKLIEEIKTDPNSQIAFKVSPSEDSTEQVLMIYNLNYEDRNQIAKNLILLERLGILELRKKAWEEAGRIEESDLDGNKVRYKTDAENHQSNITGKDSYTYDIDGKYSSEKNVLAWKEYKTQRNSREHRSSVQTSMRKKYNTLKLEMPRDVLSQKVHEEKWGNLLVALNSHANNTKADDLGKAVMMILASFLVNGATFNNAILNLKKHFGIKEDRKGLDIVQNAVLEALRGISLKDATIQAIETVSKHIQGLLELIEDKSFLSNKEELKTKIADAATEFLAAWMEQPNDLNSIDAAFKKFKSELNLDVTLTHILKSSQGKEIIAGIFVAVLLTAAVILAFNFLAPAVMAGTLFTIFSLDISAKVLTMTAIGATGVIATASVGGYKFFKLDQEFKAAPEVIEGQVENLGQEIDQQIRSSLKPTT